VQRAFPACGWCSPSLQPGLPGQDAGWRGGRRLCAVQQRGHPSYRLDPRALPQHRLHRLCAHLRPAPPARLRSQRAGRSHWHGHRWVLPWPPAAAANSSIAIPLQRYFRDMGKGQRACNTVRCSLACSWQRGGCRGGKAAVCGARVAGAGAPDLQVACCCCHGFTPCSRHLLQPPLCSEVLQPCHRVCCGLLQGCADGAAVPLQTPRCTGGWECRVEEGKGCFRGSDAGAPLHPLLVVSKQDPASAARFNLCTRRPCRLQQVLCTSC
jgi:hypothetical protein